MEILTKHFFSNSISIYPIGDIHIGDKCFGKESKHKLFGYIHWIKHNPTAYAILMGDIVNCATINSPSSPFQQDMDLKDQIATAVKYFEPIKDKIIGALDGNHEQRLSRYAGYSPTISICERLQIKYLESSAVVIFRLGCLKKILPSNRSTHRPRASFAGYFHHTTGGGATPGGKINRVEKLTDVVADCDFYCGAHNHGLGVMPRDIYIVDRVNSREERLRQMLIDCGGYLEWRGSYAEQKQLSPLKIGSPRINLFLKRKSRAEFGGVDVIKDIHVSI